MDRREAIRLILKDTYLVRVDHCAGSEEWAETQQETRAALRALGVADAEIQSILKDAHLVRVEHCAGSEEWAEAERKTHDALRALGVTDAEIDEAGEGLSR